MNAYINLYGNINKLTMQLIDIPILKVVLGSIKIFLVISAVVWPIAFVIVYISLFI